MAALLGPNLSQAGGRQLAWGFLGAGEAAGCLAVAELSGSFLPLRAASVAIWHMTGDFSEK